MTTPNNPHHTRVVKGDADGIAEAAALIAEGQCVAVPTETVYGLAADATRADAVARIYEAKGRPSFNPLIVHVNSFEEATRLAVFNEDALTLARRFWPGPLTLVLPLRTASGIAPAVLAGLNSIAVRVPAHPVMRALLAACDHPLAAPSANASGRITPTCAAHVLRTLAGRISLLIDGGPAQAGLESTIVALTGGSPRLLRPGPISIQELGLNGAASNGAIEAPGQLASHYKPMKPVILNRTTGDAATWLIGFGDIAGDANLSPSGNLQEAAALLYVRLHDADASERDLIAVAPIPNEGLGMAINDRLQRAATP